MSVDIEKPSIRSAPVGSGRLAAFDGLRGLACLLVVFGHLWLIVPSNYLDRANALRGIFYSHNLAVTLFMVLGGLLVTRGLLREEELSGQFYVARFWVRRLVRIGVQLVPLLLVIVIVNRVERGSPYSNSVTQRSAERIATFTYNWQLIDHALESRPDLGHLWYLSVEQQFYLVWLATLAWFSRHRLLLVMLLAMAVGASWWWRMRLYDEPNGWWPASLSTASRADALCLGALAALGYPVARRLRWASGVVTIVAGCALVTIALLSPRLGEHGYLKSEGMAFAAIAAVFVLGLACADRGDGPVERSLAWGPFLALGRVSLPLYLWHLPVFYAADRWARDLGWVPRAAMAIVALAVIVLLADRLIERPVSRRLRLNRLTWVAEAGRARS